LTRYYVMKTTMTTPNDDCRRSWRLMALGAAGAWIALSLMRSSRKKPSSSSADEPTDFASFLVAPVAAAAPEEAPASRWGGCKKAAALETSFDSFLKVRVEPDPADFASFLRDGGGGVNKGAAALKQQQQPPVEAIPPDRAPVLVLYGTEYGFAREIAEKLADAMKKMQQPPETATTPATTTLPWPCVVDMADATPSLLGAQQAALLVCSTQGDGVPPTEARGFCEWVFGGCKADAAAAAAAAAASASSSSILAPPRHSVLALGDTAYTHFCRCGKMLDTALQEAGSSPFTPRVDVDKEDWKAVDGWIAAVLDALPSLGLAPLSALGDAQAAVALGGAGCGSVGADAATTTTTSATKKPLAWSKSRPFPARVAAVEPLCKGLTGDWRQDKVTARLELDVAAVGEEGGAAAAAPEELRYAPGDALGIWPLNAPEAVNALLRCLAEGACRCCSGGQGDGGGALATAAAAAAALGAAPVPTPSWHYSELEPQEGGAAGRPPVAAPKPASLPLREALERCYDLRAPKGEPLLRALRAALPAASSSSADADADAPAANGNGNGHAANGNGNAANGNGAGKQQQQQQQQSEEETARLDALLAGGRDAVDAYLEPRHVIDVLREHPAATAAMLRGAAGGGGGEQEAAAAAAAAAAAVQRALLPHLRQLQPRLYSISSSPLEAPGRVQATIAVVRYESLGDERVGVCSTYAIERAEAAPASGRRQQAEQADAAAAAAATTTTTTTTSSSSSSSSPTMMRVYIHHNPDFRLPADSSTPIIMVGPGTGLAPFRAFILQRLLERKQAGSTDAGAPALRPPPPGDADNMVLFFGSRRRDQDYLYGDQLEQWSREGLLTLHTAFSREPGQPKVYVQQRLREAGAQVWRLLSERGAHFYVCGDASSMAPAVERALLGVMEREGGLTAEEAEARLAAMAREGKYQRDVWFG
jgi:sulfite reductase (NADPH) flavoprotein alpha-component